MDKRGLDIGEVEQRDGKKELLHNPLIPPKDMSQSRR